METAKQPATYAVRKIPGNLGALINLVHNNDGTWKQVAEGDMEVIIEVNAKPAVHTLVSRVFQRKQKEDVR